MGTSMRPRKLFQRIGPAASLSQQIEEYLESSIRKKRLRPGQKLPTELELCKQFGVSRTPLREALRNLRSRGLITVKMGRGMFVGELSAKDALSSLNLYFELKMDADMVLSVIRARQTFEPRIAALAARNRTEEDLAAIRKTVEDLRTCDPRDFERSGVIDNSFHQAVACATRNPVIPTLMQPIHSLIPKAREMVYGKVDPRSKVIAVEFHSKILEAIAAQDAAEAEKQMAAHLAFTERNVLAALQARGQTVAGRAVSAL